LPEFQLVSLNHFVDLSGHTKDLENPCGDAKEFYSVDKGKFAATPMARVARCKETRLPIP
jgi:hypothetical protein